MLRLSRHPRTDPATARLTGWIEPVVERAGYDLEELVVTPAGRRSVVRVVVDRDSGVTLDDIAEVSRAVSDVLDASDDGMGRAPYVLEVTSPGVDRPLTEPRHWRRNVGRLVTVAVGRTVREQVTGRITAVRRRGDPGRGGRASRARSAAADGRRCPAQLGAGGCRSSSRPADRAHGPSRTPSSVRRRAGRAGRRA